MLDYLILCLLTSYELRQFLVAECISVLHYYVSGYSDDVFAYTSTPPTYLGVAYLFCSSLCRERRDFCLIGQGA